MPGQLRVRGTLLSALPFVAIAGVFLMGLSVVALLMPVAVGGMMVMVQAAIYTQSARYAASLTGLKPIMRQPDFFAAVGKGLLITSLILFVGGLVMGASIIVLKEFGGAEQYWWLDREALNAAVVLAMESPQAAERMFSFQSMNIGSLLSTFQIISFFFITVIGLFLVPRAAGLSEREIALYTAQMHTQPVPRILTLPELAGERLGAAGIPATRIPGVAANFGDEGVVYIIRAPRHGAVQVPQWGLAVENEWVILNQIPEEWIVGTMPAARVPALTVDPGGTPSLVLGR